MLNSTVTGRLARLLVLLAFAGALAAGLATAGALPTRAQDAAADIADRAGLEPLTGIEVPRATARTPVPTLQPADAMFGALRTSAAQLVALSCREAAAQVPAQVAAARLRAQERLDVIEVRAQEHAAERRRLQREEVSARQAAKRALEKADTDPTTSTAAGAAGAVGSEDWERLEEFERRGRALDQRELAREVQRMQVTMSLAGIVGWIEDRARSDGRECARVAAGAARAA